MKYTTGLLLTALFLTIVISSCSSLGKTETADLVESPLTGDLSERKALPDGWSYETEIIHEGSRSEGSVSRIFYRYNEIPTVFNRLLIGTEAFEYKAMKNIWDNSGYITNTFGNSLVPEETESISPAEMKRGWYFSSLENIKKGTPSGWIWAEGGEYEIRISPEKIVDFVIMHNMQEISSGPELMLKSE